MYGVGREVWSYVVCGVWWWDGMDLKGEAKYTMCVFEGRGSGVGTLPR